MYRVLLVLLLLVTMFSVQTVFAQDESDGEALADGEYSAVISAGPAFIRAAASPDGEALGRCPTGESLTIWLPAVGDWLTSSCLGVNGYIHSSLVEIGEMVVPDEAMMEEETMMEEDDSMMEEEAMEEEAMMEEDDSMMEEEAMEEEPAVGEHTAVISKGPARIRTAASLEGEILGLCPRGQDLTVWLPAVGDWLTSSCLGVNGYIHSSLVTVGDAVVPEEAMEEEAMMEEDDSMMEEEAMEEEAMMEEDDSMMEDDEMMEDDDMEEAPAAGEYAAVIAIDTAGRARIRAEASLEGEIVGHCQRGQQLTVWLPAVNDEWLTSSCHDVNGYIHSSLVEVGDPVIPEIEDLGDSDDMAMEDDMSMDDEM